MPVREDPAYVSVVELGEGGRVVSNPAERESTLAREEVSLRLHAIPSLGHNRLDQVSPRQIQQIVNEGANHRAARSARRDYGVVRAIFL